MAMMVHSPRDSVSGTIRLCRFRMRFGAIFVWSIIAVCGSCLESLAGSCCLLRAIIRRRATSPARARGRGNLRWPYLASRERATILRQLSVVTAQTGAGTDYRRALDATRIKRTTRPHAPRSDPHLAQQALILLLRCRELPQRGYAGIGCQALGWAHGTGRGVGSPGRCVRVMHQRYVSELPRQGSTHASAATQQSN